MFEVKITVEAPALVLALDKFARSMGLLGGDGGRSSVASVQAVEVPPQQQKDAQLQTQPWQDAGLPVQAVRPLQSVQATPQSAPQYAQAQPVQYAQSQFTTPQPNPQPLAYQSAQVAPATPGVTAEPAPTQPLPTAAPMYTQEQLARAGAALGDAGYRDVIAGLLQKYGVISLPTLPTELYGQFANDLRALGAQI